MTFNGTWSYAYDSMGNVTSVTDANGNITTYAYDINGQVTSVTNAAGNTATTTYDQYGRVAATLRDLLNNPVPKGNSGLYFDHWGEIQYAYTAIIKAAAAINKMLLNPYLSEEARSVLEYASKIAQQYIELIDFLGRWR